MDAEKSENIKPDTFPKYQKNPILEGLPDFVKDHNNYEKVQRTLLETLASKHSHSEVGEWSKCVECQLNVKEHTRKMRSYGFKSGAQYKAWHKVMETIKTRVR